MHGFLAVNKPSGVSSAKHLEKLKAHLPKKTRVGHTGTLDPLASGVLVVAIGNATRFIRFLPGRKHYQVEVAFGVATDTYDSEGQVLETRPLPNDLVRIVEDSLNRFMGVVSQCAPKYSALKHKGVPLYELMRKGREKEVPVKMRKAHMHAIKVERWVDEKTAVMRVCCGGGVYMRSLAHDLGKAAGCGAHMSGLLRRKCNGFGLDEAIDHGQIERDMFSRLRTIKDALSHMDGIRLDERQSIMARQGQQLMIEGKKDGKYCILGEAGNLLGVGMLDGSILKPIRMLPAKTAVALHA